MSQGEGRDATQDIHSAQNIVLVPYATLLGTLAYSVRSGSGEACKRPSPPRTKQHASIPHSCHRELTLVAQSLKSRAANRRRMGTSSGRFRKTHQGDETGIESLRRTHGKITTSYRFEPTSARNEIVATGENRSSARAGACRRHKAWSMQPFTRPIGKPPTRESASPRKDNDNLLDVVEVPTCPLYGLSSSSSSKAKCKCGIHRFLNTSTSTALARSRASNSVWEDGVAGTYPTVAPERNGWMWQDDKEVEKAVQGIVTQKGASYPDTTDFPITPLPQRTKAYLSGHYAPPYIAGGVAGVRELKRTCVLHGIEAMPIKPECRPHELIYTYGVIGVCCGLPRCALCPEGTASLLRPVE